MESCGECMKKASRALGANQVLILNYQLSLIPLIHNPEENIKENLCRPDPSEWLRRGVQQFLS